VWFVAVLLIMLRGLLQAALARVFVACDHNPDKSRDRKAPSAAAPAAIHYDCRIAIFIPQNVEQIRSFRARE